MRRLIFWTPAVGVTPTGLGRCKWGGGHLVRDQCVTILDGCGVLAPPRSGKRPSPTALVLIGRQSLSRQDQFPDLRPVLDAVAAWTCHHLPTGNRRVQ